MPETIAIHSRSSRRTTEGRIGQVRGTPGRGKRLMDIVLSALALLFLSPALLVIVGVLFLADGRPFIFSHKRIGRNGRPFSCLKFRTMRRDADARLAELLANDPECRKEWEEKHKLLNDPRIHRVGKFLRVSSLDELPQFLNVLRGEMSLVGPRPVVASELERYGRDADYYLALTPGITGLWQISGRNDTSYRERVKYDVEYYETQSVWKDIVILWKTVGVVLFARNGC